MSSAPTSSAGSKADKPFEPGTTGWTAADLDDPRIEREWFRGRYEIVEGVLTLLSQFRHLFRILRAGICVPATPSRVFAPRLV